MPTSGTYMVGINAQFCLSLHSIYLCMCRGIVGKRHQVDGDNKTVKNKDFYENTSPFL